MSRRAGSLPVVSGLVAAGLASACCVVPLALVLLGIGGAWISLLTSLEPWRPLFITLALVSFSYAAFSIYGAKTHCDEAGACHDRARSRGPSVLFWIGLAVSVALITSPDWIPWFF